MCECGKGCLTPSEVTAREAAAWATGAAAMRESAAMLADTARTYAEWGKQRAKAENHTSEVHHQEGRWHASNDIEEDLRALPLPPMPGTTQGDAGSLADDTAKLRAAVDKVGGLGWESLDQFQKEMRDE